MPRMTGATALIEMLKAEGVEYVFGNPGTAESAILDALEDAPELKYILSVQESAVMGMADAYARVTGNVAFVNLHIDSGLANGIALLTNAYEGGTPLVLTSANKDVRKLAEGRVNLHHMTEEFTKWSVEVTHPEQIPSVVRRAFTIAKTPPTGPVYIAFAANALDDEGEMAIVPSAPGYAEARPDPAAISAAAAILEVAANPVLIVGDRVGLAGGASEAVRLAELTGARVYATNLGRVNFPTSHPQYLGTINPTMPAARAALADADAVVMVGTAFSGFFYFEGEALPNAKLIHIDSDADAVGRSEPTDVGIVAGPKAGMADLSTALEARLGGEAREAATIRAATVAAQKEAQRQAWRARLEARRDLSPMSTERMMTEVAAALPQNTLFVDDSITTRASVYGALDFDEPNDLVGISGGALGWGMGAALGAKLARPDQPVVAVVGDGSAMMTIQALWTAAASKIPVVWVVCNNESYRVLKLNMNVWQTQIAHRPEPQTNYLGMDFAVPFDIAAIANAFGVRGRRIEDPATLGAAITEAIASNEPTVLDVRIDGSI
ncbi:MAG: thiamine pyrophosphate-binding protein [Chloroflexi bacterium]|nr:thiamine pyrophosphate-binding protein [Chloroflexota bacterium]MDA1147100.1 thiamine pyrophosphate-binding protein [Chloroflexota bacterium]